MEQRELKRYFFAGLFVMVGVFLLFQVIYILGKDKGLTQPKFQIIVHYLDVNGLQKGAPIRIAGVNVGNVASVGFLEQEVDGRRVEVVLNIFNKYRKQLQKPSNFVIQSEGILGEKLIEITESSEGPPLDLTQPIKGADSISVDDLAAVFAQAAQAFTKASEDLSTIDYKHISEIVAEGGESLTATSRGINEVLIEMKYVTKKTKRLINRVEGKLIDDDLFKVF